MSATTTTTNDVVVDNDNGDNNDVDRWTADKLRVQNNCKNLARYLIMLCVKCHQDIELLFLSSFCATCSSNTYSWSKLVFFEKSVLQCDLTGERSTWRLNIIMHDWDYFLIWYAYDNKFSNQSCVLKRSNQKIIKKFRVSFKSVIWCDIIIL